MFKFLKDKLKSWFKKSEEKADKKKPAKKEKVVEITKTAKKEKQEKKPLKIVHKERSEQELKEERLLSQEIKQDIEKQGLAIKSPETRFEEQESEKTQEKEPMQEEKKGFFSRLKGKFSFKITEEYFNEIFNDLELILLENNVAFSVVEKLKENLKKELLNTEIKKENLKQEITNALKISIESLFVEKIDLLERIKSKEGVFTIVFFGINGSGKTTSIAKIANLLLKNKISCILAAGDTFRAASIEQLAEHGNKLGIKTIKGNYGSDPAAVAFDAIQHAKSHKIKVVLIDTAGRMHTKSDLLREMEKIIRISKPDLKIFVAESITGNDATEQAKTFNDAIGIDAIILTKADVDEKAGTILSVSHVTGKPIIYLGVGQKYDDILPFDKKKVVEGLLE